MIYRNVIRGLARKYRPSSFEEVVGQEHVIQALANSILQDRIHQAFIFWYKRVGKTTLAKFLQNALIVHLQKNQ